MLYGAYNEAREHVGAYLEGHVNLVRSLAKVALADYERHREHQHDTRDAPLNVLQDLLAEASGPLDPGFRSYEVRLILPPDYGALEYQRIGGQHQAGWEPELQKGLDGVLARAFNGETGTGTIRIQDRPLSIFAFAPLTERGGAIAVSVHLFEVAFPFLVMAAVLMVASMPPFLGGMALLRVASQTMQRRLDFQEAESAATLNSLSDGLITFDEEGKCLSINRAARRLLGLHDDASPSQVGVANILKIKGAAESCFGCTDNCRTCVNLLPNTQLSTRSDGEVVELEVMLRPLEVAGARAGTIIRLLDVTEVQQVRRREAVQRRLDAALESFNSRALTVLSVPVLIAQAGELLRSEIGTDTLAVLYEDKSRSRHHLWPTDGQVAPGATLVETCDGAGARAAVLVPAGAHFPATYASFAQTVTEVVLLAAAKLIILEEIVRREARLLEVTEETGDALCRFDARGRIEFVNPAYCELVGMDRDACLESSFFDIHGSEIQEQVESVRFNVPKIIDMRTSRNEDDQWIRWTIIRVHSLDGSDHFQASGKDISELQQSRNALRERERILAAVHRCSSILLASEDWRPTLPELLAQIGPAAEATRAYVYRVRHGSISYIENLAEWTREGFGPLASTDFRAIQWGGGPFDGVLDQLANGRFAKFSLSEVAEPARSYLDQVGVKTLMAFPIMVSGAWWGLVGLERSLLRDEWSPSSLEGLQSIANALSVSILRKKTVDQLRDSESFAKTLMTSAPEAIIVADEHGRIIHWNVRAAEMLGGGFDSVGAETLDSLVIPGSSLAHLIETTLKTGRVPDVPLATEALAYGGMRIQIEVSVGLWYRAGQPLLSLIIRDIRHRIDAERHLRQAQKIEALGNLAGGIAHDFNNLLLPILALSDLMLDDGALDPDAREQIAIIRSAAEQGRQLVSRILAFSRESGQDMECLDVGQVVQEALCVLGATVPTSVDIRYHAEASATVQINKPLFHAVLFNLVKNGVDAIGAGTGAIDITLRRIPAGDHLRGLGVELDGGRDHVALIVADSGHGMGEAVLSRIFDPYFTTKGVGEGTGLGLMMVHDVVSKHGGHVVAESVVGKGSTFTIVLPVVQQNDFIAA